MYRAPAGKADSGGKSMRMNFISQQGFTVNGYRFVKTFPAGVESRSQISAFGFLHESMARFKLYIEYEGTRFKRMAGAKKCTKRTGELIGAMKSVFGNRRLRVVRAPAGRRRRSCALSGGAFLSQNSACTAGDPHESNDLLPADINIIEVEKATPDFMQDTMRLRAATCINFQAANSIRKTLCLVD